MCVCWGGFGWKLDLRFPLLRIMPPLLWLQIRDWNQSSQNTCFPLSGLPESSLLFLLPLKCSSWGSFGGRPGPGGFHLLIWWKPAAHTPPPELACPSWRQCCRIFFDIRSAAWRDRKSSAVICVEGAQVWTILLLLVWLKAQIQDSFLHQKIELHWIYTAHNPSVAYRHSLQWMSHM